MSFTLLHPTRSRTAKSKDTILNWIKKATGQTFLEIIISVDLDDPMISEYKELYLFNSSWKDDYGVEMVLVSGKNRSAIDAINAAARAAEFHKFIVVSDDSDCPQYWDESLKILIKNKTDFIVKTQDGIQPWMITMPVMDRTYYNRFGYIYHPDYLHMFCDTELTCVADILGRKITSDLMFPHKHYSVTKESPDQVARRNDSTWAQGEKIFLERYKKNFDLPKGQPIQDGGMIRYLQRVAPR